MGFVSGMAVGAVAMLVGLWLVVRALDAQDRRAAAKRALELKRSRDMDAMMKGGPVRWS